MLLKHTLGITLAALLVVGCGKKSDADTYLDQLDDAASKGTALIKEKQPKSMEELVALPGWKEIDEKGRAASDSLSKLKDNLTPDQKKRFDDINKRVNDMETLMAPAMAPSTPPASDTGATQPPATTTPADTTHK